MRCGESPLVLSSPAALAGRATGGRGVQNKDPADVIVRCSVSSPGQRTPTTPTALSSAASLTRPYRFLRCLLVCLFSPSPSSPYKAPPAPATFAFPRQSPAPIPLLLPPNHPTSRPAPLLSCTCPAALLLLKRSNHTTIHRLRNDGTIAPAALAHLAS